MNTTRGPPPPCSRPAAAAALAHPAAASLSPRWNRDWNHASPPPLPPLESHWNRDWNHASPPPPPPLYAHVDDLRVRTRPARTPTATWRATPTPTSRCCAPSGPQRATRACRSRGPQRRRLESVLESGLESADVCARSAAPRVPLSRATAPTGIRTVRVGRAQVELEAAAGRGPPPLSR